MLRGRPRRRVDVLLALLGTSDAADVWVDGAALTTRLEAAGRNPGPASVLTTALGLEEAGLVRVRREGGHRFALTDAGETAAYELGPGAPADCVLVMVDLVGFVTFTADHGDDAAHRAARRLHEVADGELRGRGGRLVKHLGDGVLGTVDALDAAAPTVRAIATRCTTPDGRPWPVRAAAHAGRPIHHGGDVFGADVNLVSRLCALAGPGELVVSSPGHPAAELVDVRGLADAVPVTRVAIA